MIPSTSITLHFLNFRFEGRSLTREELRGENTKDLTFALSPRFLSDPSRWLRGSPMPLLQ